MQRFQPIQHRCIFRPVGRYAARGRALSSSRLSYASRRAPVCQLQSPKDGWAVHHRATLTSGTRDPIACDHVTVNGISKGFARYSTGAEAAARVIEDLAPTNAYMKDVNSVFLQTSGQTSKPTSALNGTEDDRARVQSADRTRQTDIYNYAARFGAGLTMKLEKASGMIKITYELAKQGIRVEGVGATYNSARADAVREFKRMAANYCWGNAEAISTMASTTLTTKNARQFLKYHRVTTGSNEPVMKVEEVDEEEYGRTLFVATVFLNGEEEPQLIYDFTAKDASITAQLVAAISLRGREPEFWTQYLQELKRGSGKIVWPVKKPSSLDLYDNALSSMRDTLRKVKANNFYEERAPPDFSSGSAKDFRQMRVPRLSYSEAASRSQELMWMQQKLQANPRLSGLRQKVEALPANQMRQEISTVINNNVYSIVVGATGSGKSTQIPQILFDNAIKSGKGALCNVMVTQPRRIAATSVASRVAAERDVSITDTVGHQVRFDNKLPKFTGSISFCTVGILLQHLQYSLDELFTTLSHLIIDEVHERDLNLDFLLITLKTAVEQRLQAGKKVPRITFMSATANTSLFANYFKTISADGVSKPCPQIHIPGRTYPVRELYLEHVLDTFSKSNYDAESLSPLLQESRTAKYLKSEEAFVNKGVEGSEDNNERSLSSLIDWDTIHDPNIVLEKDGTSQELEDPPVAVGLAAATIAHIAKTTDNGAILVFLPGFQSIKELEEILLQNMPLDVNFAEENKFRIYKLHSSLPTSQKEVFDIIPKGCRKIILATNIAETSITIPEVRYVVDTGKTNMLLYDQRRRVRKLACCWISQSNAKQRAGRAGRVEDGNYYALYTQRRHSSLPVIASSEMLRLDLQEICLKVKATGPQRDIRDFLSRAIEPPAPELVDTSVVQLQALQTLDEKENLTALGSLLAGLPIHPNLGKMIVLGIIFRCLGPMIILGAAAGERNLFMYPPPEYRQTLSQVRHKFAAGSDSDHIAMINAYHKVREIWRDEGKDAAFQFSVSNWISFQSFRYIMRSAKQIEEMLWKAGLIPYPESDSTFTGHFGGPELNANSSEPNLIKAIFLSGVFPNLAVKNDRKLNVWQTESEGFTVLNSDSTNFTWTKREPYGLGSLAAFTSMTKAKEANMIFLEEISLVSPLMVCLFGGRLRSNNRTIHMDSWLPMTIRAERSSSEDVLATRTIFEFRKALDKMLSHTFLDLAKYTGPGGLTQENDEDGDTPVQRRYLADDPVREAFAAGLVEALCTT